jgi:tRNA A37 threonylcarbamoyladenosine dehydratase
MKTPSEQLKSLKIQQKKTDNLYKPLFYRLNEPSDAERFNKLLIVPGITVVDTILEQVKEFVKSRNPDKKFTEDELETRVKEHLGNTETDHYGVWVYYEWSNRLVHILDKDEFIEVRTSRNQYKITREERDILSTKKIGVIGLSVGQSVSVTLAMERICGELRLADFDMLELTNLNRIRTGIHNLGLAKVYSVAREIAEIDPFIQVKCFPKGLFEENMDDFFMSGGKLDLLVEESDGFDIKILSRLKARELRVPVIMEASDRCMVDVERFDLEPSRGILHGIVDHLDVETLKSLKTNEEKIPYMLDILGLESTSPRLKASMLEMQQTISTWPQLASAVTMGGGITADVSRRMLLNHFTQSGRYYVDIDELIGNRSGEEKTGSAGRVAPPGKRLTLEKMNGIAASCHVRPGSAIDEAELGKIVEAACAAPSHGNSQPWKWLSVSDNLFLFHDKITPAVFTDYKNTNSLVSLGAAIENAVLKASEAGYASTVSLFPAASEKSLVAVFGFNKATAATGKNELSPYIFSRHTNRKQGSGRSIANDKLAELTTVAGEIEGATLSLISDKEKIDSISQVVGICERLRLLHPQAHHDYFERELKWKQGEDPVLEGIDIKTLEMPSSVETAFRVISNPSVANLLNHWEKGIAFEKFLYKITSASSAIGLLTMPSASETNYLNGGRAAEKIWLAATKNNLAFQPICLPLAFLNYLGNRNEDNFFSDKTFFQIKAIKDQLSLIFSELNSREPVFLFRLSDAGKPYSTALRKPVSEVYFKS